MLRFCSLVVFVAAVGAQPVDWILSAGHVVTMDAQRRVIRDGAVAVRGDEVVAVGTRAEVDKQFQAKQRIDNPQAILTPGLINTHTHVPMALMRGIADDLRLQEWLDKFIFPAEAKNVSLDFVRDGTWLACVEMLLSGTTTFADMYYFEKAIADATVACGMRGVLGQTIIGFPVADAKTPEAGLKLAESFLRSYSRHRLIVPAVAPHAIYTNSEATLQACRKLADSYGVPLLIHLSETKKENDDIRSKYGASPTQVLDRWGILTGRTLAAHGVWIDGADMKILAKRGVGVAHCPSSNTKLASGVAPVLDYLKAGVALGLGTDGPAGSNNDLNLFEEMDLAAKLQKVHTGDPTAVSARQSFEMATINGARALGLEKEIGSIEKGKRADLIFINIAAPHAQPMYDVYSALVYALKGSDVQHVMVNGSLVVRDRKVLTIDENMVLKRAEQWRTKISASLATPQPGK
ncbi:MAG TPA: amidohydrolase [Bryobacteraceae bacterium]|nr:amidohydrolase [Bryobacteraceae bacterium]